MKVCSLNKEESSLELLTNEGKILIDVVTDSILHVIYTKEECYSKTKSLMVSYEKTNDTPFNIFENEIEISLITSKILLKINKSNCSFAYYDSNGNLLTKEPKRGGKTVTAFDLHKTVFNDSTEVEKIATVDGIKVVAKNAETAFDRISYHTKLEFEWAKGEAIYGLGSHDDNIFNLRGTYKHLYQHNMKAVIPVIVSTNHYGILMENYGLQTFRDDSFGSYIWCEVAEQLDFYFIYGESMDKIVSGYRLLTGKVPMLPKWAYGYFQSKERYETADEILEIVKTFRERDIPLDCIVLDWKSWTGDYWGQKTFDETRFPNPEKWIEDLHKLKVALMISIWPTMSKGGENNIQMVNSSFMLGNQTTYNAFSEEARKLYWRQANDGLFSKGLDAWWCDCTEPFEADWSGSDKPEPEQRLYINVEEAKKYIDPAYINAYSLEHSKGIYEGQKSVSSKRVVNLTRSAYAGQQRYATITWSGDICSTWKVLKEQISAGLNFCLTGSNYWTFDIGGFFVGGKSKWSRWCNDPTIPAPWFLGGDYDDGCEDLGYRELYTRWLQLGTFMPIFRSHGTDTPREPWCFGEKGTMFYDTIVKFINLRYSLSPYIYSLAGMVTREDYTMLRALVFDFSNDTMVYNVNDQFMFGSSLLICPVTQPMYYDVNSVEITNVPKARSLYLPKGDNWFDFWTNEFYNGGQTILANAPIEMIPIYVKCGSIVPTTSPKTSMVTDDTNDIELNIYTGKDAEFSLYDDEGDGYSYENGEYSIININWIEHQRKLIIHNRKGKYLPSKNEISFNINIITQDKDFINKTVLYCGKEIITEINLAF